MILFWAISVFCILVAMAFVLPPAIAEKQYKLAVSLGVGVPLCAYLIYGSLGAATELSTYYSGNYHRQEAHGQQLRPLYARIQRELVKNQLNIPVESENIDLILNFATLNSQQMDGHLQDNIKNLLEGVLKAVPQQITALNLLAINAYKSQDYALAIAYWQRILDQMPPHMRGSKAEKVLKNKIRDLKADRPNVVKNMQKN